MDIKEQIEVMQAFADGKKIQWRHPVGYTVWMDTDEPLWNWEMIEYRVKPEPILPKTWEEFCETHPVKEGECFISNCHKDNIGQQTGVERERLIDMNFWLPNKQLAEAMLALCQLIQLRDCYNQGWQPDGKDDICKLAITIGSGGIPAKIDSWSQRYPLVFQTIELRDAFLNNFRDLIEAAAPLL